MLEIYSVGGINHFAINIEPSITVTIKIAAIPNTIYNIIDNTSNTNVNMIVFVHKRIASKTVLIVLILKVGVGADFHGVIIQITFNSISYDYIYCCNCILYCVQFDGLSGQLIQFDIKNYFLWCSSYFIHTLCTKYDLILIAVVILCIKNKILRESCNFYSLLITEMMQTKLAEKRLLIGSQTPSSIDILLVNKDHIDRKYFTFATIMVIIDIAIKISFVAAMIYSRVLKRNDMKTKWKFLDTMSTKEEYEFLW